MRVQFRAIFNETAHASIGGGTRHRALDTSARASTGTCGSTPTNLLSGRLHSYEHDDRSGVSKPTRDRLAKLADTTGRPMTQLLDEAANALERQVFFGHFSARHDEFRTDPVAWAEVERERALESGALCDTSA